MRAAALEGHDLTAGAEDRQAQPGGVPRDTPSVTKLVEPANRNPLGHATVSPDETANPPLVTRETPALTVAVADAC